MEDHEYTEFYKAMKGVGAKKIRELAQSEGIELTPGITDRDMLVFELYDKRSAKAHVGTPAASPPPSATLAAGEPAPKPADSELQEQIRAEAVQPLVRVRALRVPERWRCRHKFTMKAQLIPADQFSAEEWKLIEADKGLEVKWPTPR
jgi:hypothetical protein